MGPVQVPVCVSVGPLVGLLTVVGVRVKVRLGNVVGASLEVPLSVTVRVSVGPLLGLLVVV